jgi:7,8-dihydroneopterin aldolase/epimerase/oxygenase
MEGIVALEGMEFYAYHGFYQEERKVGNKYVVDVSLKTNFTKAATSDDLDGTVNYETVYEIVKNQMTIPNKLLESICNKIINSLFELIPEVLELTVSVSKHNPPIGGVCEKSKVTITKQKQ